MLSKSAFVCLLAFSCSSLFSQTSFQAGYIVKSAGDTIQGLVSHPKSRSNPTLVYFKTTPGSNVQEYQSAEINAFGIRDLIFESARVSINRRFKKNERFQEVPTVEYEEQYVFLESLVDGSKKLYRYIDQNNVDRFYIGSSSQLQLLLYQEYILEKPGEETQRKAISKYLGQLYAYLSDCSELESMIKDAKYDSRSFMKIFSRYYKCNENSKLKIRIKEVKKVKPEISVMIGLSNTQIDFTGAESIGAVATEFPSSSNISLGVSGNLFFSDKKNVSFNGTLLYTSFETIGENEVFVSPTRSTFTRSSVSFSYIKFQPQLHYNYNSDDFRIFAGAGFSMGVVLEDSNEERIEERIGTGAGVRTNLLFEATNKAEVGSVLDAGVQYKKFYLRFKLEFGNGVSRDAGLNSKTTRTYLFAGIIL